MAFYTEFFRPAKPTHSKNNRAAQIAKIYTVYTTYYGNLYISMEHCPYVNFEFDIYFILHLYLNLQVSYATFTVTICL